MKHRLTGYALSLWLLKLKGEFRLRHGSLSMRANEVYNHARHAIWQGSRDTQRRGLSGREGSRNRRWRKYEATLVRVAVVEWPSMRVGMALVPKSSI